MRLLLRLLVPRLFTRLRCPPVFNLQYLDIKVLPEEGRRYLRVTPRPVVDIRKFRKVSDQLPIVCFETSIYGHSSYPNEGGCYAR